LERIESLDAEVFMKHSYDQIAALMDVERKEGSEPPKTKPGAPPRVILTWPLPCAVADKPMDLFAVASDGAKGVNSVEFLLDDRLIGSATKPPYSVHFDPAGLGDRTAVIEAEALASSGASSLFKTTVRLNGAKTGCD
jgi:hypothetical protein